MIPLIFILPSFMTDKVLAVFLAEPIADIIAVMTTVTLFALEFKKIMKDLRSDPNPSESLSRS